MKKLMILRQPIYLALLLGLLGYVGGCEKRDATLLAQKPTPPKTDAQQRYARLRKQMVKTQLLARDIHDARVLRAMEEVPRHLFIPSHRRFAAYEDRPVPIGYGQTISQPYIVAYMAQAAKIPKQGANVLEIGTGSGYGAAVLARLATKVYSIEILKSLGEHAAKTLKQLKFDNVIVRVGDGYAGWPKAAPFDAIVVTAAPPYIPPALKAQLKVGGRLVIPVGGSWIQSLKVIVRTKTGYLEESALPVRFVPMTGRAQELPASRR